MGYSWSGTKLSVEFLDTLKSNTTYSFLLGTEYTDLKGNKPDSAFAVTFSTGEKIDTGKIDGMLYGEKIEGTFIYGYRKDNKNIDTLNPENVIAEFKTQVGTNGAFTLRALPDGEFRLIAVKSDFKDNLFHPASDFFGTTANDFVVKNGVSENAKIKFGQYPNIAPNQIVSSELYQNKFLSIIFQKAFFNKSDLSEIKEYFGLYDSTSGKNIEFSAIFLDSTISGKLFFQLADSLSLQNDLTLQVRKDSLIKDTSDVWLQKGNYVFVSRVNKNDFSFSQNYIPLKDSIRKIMYDHSFTFTFNMPIQLDSSAKYFDFIRLTDSSMVDFEVVKENPNSIIILPKAELLSESWYRLKFNESLVKNVFSHQLKDTTVKFDFQTGDWRTYPAVSGMLLDKSGYGKLVLQLISNDGKDVYQTDKYTDGKWKFERVKPGKYHLETFCDENMNGKYDCGLAFPYVPAEKFKIFKNEIEVKDRWDIENVMLLFDE